MPDFNKAKVLTVTAISLSSIGDASGLPCFDFTLEEKGLHRHLQIGVFDFNCPPSLRQLLSTLVKTVDHAVGGNPSQKVMQVVGEKARFPLWLKCGIAANCRSKTLVVGKDCIINGFVTLNEVPGMIEEAASKQAKK